jgi:hypothetical protein
MINYSQRVNIFHRIIRFGGRFIDYPSAIVGAIIMGLIVGAINISHGWWPATTAALKQAAYTFLFGGMMIRLLYIIVLAIPGKFPATAISVISVSILTILLVYLLHNLRGTPMPLESTLPTVFMAPPGFFFLARRKKKHQMSG